MGQELLLVEMYLLGLACALGVGPRRDPLLCAALAFPLGLALSVMLVLALIFAGVPVHRGQFELPVLLGVAGFTVNAVRRRALDREAWSVLRWCLLGFAIVLTAASLIGHTAIDREPSRLLEVARQAGDDHLVLDGLWRRLSRIGMFPLITRTLGGVTGIMLVASAIGLVAAVAWRSRALVATLILLVVVLAATALVARHPLFGVTHLTAAMYGFGFLGLWWLAESGDDDALVAPALICLGALALQTPTSPFLAAALLALVNLAGRRLRGAPSAAFTAAALAWSTLPAAQLPHATLTVGAMGAIAAAFVLGLLLARDRRRAVALIFATTLVAMLAGNVATLVHGQRLLPSRFRIVVHDEFTVRGAAGDVRARSIELLEREP